MMSFIAMVFTSAFLACFVAGTTAYSISSDCPTPEAPDNGRFYFYSGGMTVKYECDPGYTLLGEAFARCEDYKWSPEAPQCLQNDDSSTVTRNSDAGSKETGPYSLPLFSWDQEEENATTDKDPDIQNPGKVVIPVDAMLPKHELHPVRDTDPDVATVALSTDDEGLQSDEAARQRYEYTVAQHYWYPRHALVDPTYYTYVTPVLSDNQIHWINSLHPDLRNQYLRDIYGSRYVEAEEGARAQAFLSRYEDAYGLFYHQPYYVRQPLAAMVIDPLASYDYSCHQADDRGVAHLVHAPAIPNAESPVYESNRNTNYPYNAYLSAVYRCKRGYKMRDDRFSTLHCSHKSWYGERPICDYTGE